MNLLDKANIITTPTAYSEGKLHSVKPEIVLGPELVTNGDFATDSDWIKRNGSTISGGVGNIIANGSTNWDYLNWSLQQQNIFIPSTSYRIQFRARQTSGSGNFNVGYSWAFILNQAITSSFVDYSIDFTTSSSVGYNSLSFGGLTIGDTFEIDNLSVKEDISADFDFTRGSSATRVNEAGLIESVAANIPRINYENGIGHLLLEPQRTNLATYSSEFDNAAWDIITESTSTMSITPNYATAQNGLSASRLVATRPSTSFLSLIANYVSNTNTATKSLWIKNNNSGSVNINISDQAITVTDTWQRYEITNNYAHATIGLRYASADLNCDISIAGFQFELGSYSTSYIPTNGSAVTRVAETCNNAGNSDIIPSDEGVLYAEIALLENDGVNSISISSGSNNDRVLISYNSIGRLDANILSGSAYQAIFNYTGVSNTKAFNKIAFKYKENDFALWVNGIEVATDSSGITPVGLNVLNFSTASIAAANFYGKTRMVAVFPYLSNDELECLTS
jgi:hypothetical protein